MAKCSATLSAAEGEPPTTTPLRPRRTAINVHPRASHPTEVVTMRMVGEIVRCGNRFGVVVAAANPDWPGCVKVEWSDRSLECVAESTLSGRA